eukprot:TRINITY_DN12094_c0_g1_i1.p1 TRINITY_DN12094_c0_g1~~TRINITY_DN12094_c0_g1_i1.p1  ORF type:complete len:166 (+),score=6.34 TRINITY_DN12094_c0_g1_i1:112-609(+)
MEFSHVGAQCSLEECRQHDFLPFKCDCCSKVYCLDHRTYAKHSCAKGLAKRELFSSIQCPLCQHHLVIKQGEDANALVTQHIEAKCKPIEQQRKESNKCSHAKCKKSELMPIRCTKCHKQFCLNHRFPNTHSCPSLKSSQAQVNKTWETERNREAKIRNEVSVKN